MRVIAKSTLVRFWEGLPAGTLRRAAQGAVSEWYATVCEAEWKTFADLKATFNSADYVGNGKVVFDIGGNKFRLVALIGFRTARVFVLFIGTHAEYDRIDIEGL